MRQKAEGVLYGVGVGPGDPELITVKAVKKIAECDVIGIPAKDAVSCTAYNVAKEAVGNLDGKPVIEVPVPMTSDTQILSEIYNEGSRRLLAELGKGKNIAFLNLGDPALYGSYMELHERVVKAGGRAEIISGVPSFCAVAAALGIPLGSRKDRIHILPGRYHANELDRYGGTTVLMKSGKKTGEIREKLMELQESGRVSVSAVTNCGMENQAVFEDIAKLPDDAGYFTTIIIKKREKE